MEKTALLKTERCTLRPPSDADRHGVVALLVDARVRKYLGGPLDQTQAGCKFDGLFASPEMTWVALENSSGTFIALISLHRHHDGEGTEISYQFSPDFWGKGYATECIQRVVEHAFADLGLKFLLAETQSANKNSCRLLERIGMTFSKQTQRCDATQSIYIITA